MILLHLFVCLFFVVDVSLFLYALLLIFCFVCFLFIRDGMSYTPKLILTATCLFNHNYEQKLHSLLVYMYLSTLH